jgi:isoamylase
VPRFPSHRRGDAERTNSDSRATMKGPGGARAEFPIRTMSGKKITVRPGRPLPLGVTDCCDGFNFAVFSRHAERVELLLFEDPTSAEPLSAFDLDPAQHRTGDIWHALLDGVRWGQAYAYRVHGPWVPEAGQRFDGKALLLDPYALAIATPTPRNGRGLLVNRRFDWQGTSRPRTPWSETVIYETHVRGLTIDPSANSAHPGTFLGLIDKIPYFRDLGISALEFMPVQEFAEQIPLSRDTPLRNYWGYNPVAFFAPHRGYAAAAEAGSPIDEFKTMVRALHRAGIEVILDVVFNHTAEGNEFGPLYNLRGFDNPIYYLLGTDKRQYLNFSGCGNTVNCNHPLVRDTIIDCLRYWVTEMQIDGFRFDLASILGRDEEGRLAANPPLLESIAEDPILRDVKLIAEAWDAGGAYQVGSFPGQRWAEWNGRFRDDVRRFWRGDAGMTGAFASRLCGSADLYQKSGKEPVNSINFVACHDGFTLADTVSYTVKRNEANGEDNRDGAGENFSANYGLEGSTADPEIERTRLRQIKNMLATLLLSRGVPMILGGDEFRRTQRGNNNAYCQDNEVSWYDWRLLVQNHELFRFVRELIAFRMRNPVLREDAFYTDQDLEWFGPAGQPPDWDGPTRALGCLVRPRHGAGALILLFNASGSPVEFHLPAAPAGPWRVAIDTGNGSPSDISPLDGEPSTADSGSYRLTARALAVLLPSEASRS